MDYDVLLFDNGSKAWTFFTNPVEVMLARRPAEVEPLLRHICEEVETRGLFAAGFISYEAAPGFDSALRVREGIAFPLSCFGLYRKPATVMLNILANGCVYSIGTWTSGLGRGDYLKAIAMIKERIRQGDTYQVNYTFRMHAPFSGDPLGLFRDMVGAQETGCAAYMELEEYALCSASPELFFERENARIICRPMKGTASRGLTVDEDKLQASRLASSEKNRAENLMIVDMIRNDLGKIAGTGSIEVPDLFTVETYSTLLQMTSTVIAETDAEMPDVFKALFPCASVTGAPKIKTMEIIGALETAPRNIYTGSMGFIAPGRRARFNVAIRTALVDKKKEQAEFGVGSGIVWDSVADEEHEECRMKASFLLRAKQDFMLLETMRWEPDTGIFLLDYHLRRLEASAKYFRYSVDMESLRKTLDEFSPQSGAPAQKVRLLLSSDGRISLESYPLDEAKADSDVRLGIAKNPVDAGNLFLCHKTTKRKDYDDAMAGVPGADDVLLWNERGEITESCYANIVVKLGDVLCTPPVSCGLLAGTYRQWLIDQGILTERIIYKNMLKECAEIYLINSVRGRRKVRLLVDY